MKVRIPCILQISMSEHIQKANNNTDVKMEDDEPPAKAAKIEASPEIEEPSGSLANITTASGRRRGKRKVMKKVQSRDDEGYLGTLSCEL